MAMRLTSAGTRRSSSQSSSASLRFLNNTKPTRHYSLDSDEDSHPSLQFKIPHTARMQPPRSVHHHYKPSRRSRSSSPATMRVKRSPQDDEEAAMMQYLNQHAGLENRPNMPETWSVKLPAYHQQNPAAPKKQSRKSYPPPNSMFRGNASGVSPAVANSCIQDNDEWLERREPFATIEESSEKKRWKRWFMNH